MANTIGFSCPNCGGEISVREGVRVAACSYCGSKFVLSTLFGAERYFVEPKITPTKNTILKYLKENSTILDIDLFFAPVIVVNSEIFGWIYAYKKGKIVTHYEQDSQYKSKPVSTVKGRELIKKSINVMKNITIFPEENIPLGLERLDLQDLNLKPYDDEKMHKYGSVLDLPENIDFYLNIAIKKMKDKMLEDYRNFDELKYRLNPVSTHMRIYYYPVILSRYKGGTISIDGINGNILLNKEDTQFSLRQRKRIPVPLFTFILTTILSLSSVFLNWKISTGIFIVFFLMLLTKNYGD